MHARNQLAQLSKNLKQTQIAISGLSKLPDQAGTNLPLPDEGDPRLELSADIQQSLKELEQDFETLRQQFEDQTNNSSWSAGSQGQDTLKEHHYVELATQFAKFSEDLKMWVMPE